MSQKGKTLIKDIIIFMVGSVGSKLILFLLVPLYTNYMTTEEYGSADLVFTVAQLLVPFVSAVIFDAVVRFGLMKTQRHQDVLVSAFVVFGVGAAVTVLLTPLACAYEPINEWKWYLCAYTVLNIILPIELNYLKVNDRNKLYATASIIQTLVLALLNVLLLTYMRTGVRGYLISNIAACAAAVIIVFFAGKIGPALKEGKFSSSLLREMLKYSAPLILNNISWWIIHSSNKLMLEIMLGASILGIYTVATKIPSLINVFISVFSQAWGISSIKEIENTKETSFYSEVFSIYSTLAFMASALLVTIVKPFMSLYVGSDFRTAWQYVPLLLVSAVFSAISSFYGSLYGALKKSRNNMVTTLVAAAVNISLNYIFIRTVGIWGAVIGTVAAYVVVALMRMADVQRFIKLKINVPLFAANCVIIILQAVAVSFDWYGYAVSGATLLILVVINKKTLTNMIKSLNIKKILASKKTSGGK